MSSFIVGSGGGSGGVATINGDVGSATGDPITLTGGTSGAIFTGSGSTMTQSFDYLALPTTTSTDGQITINSNRFMHSYGTRNTFLGEDAGNFTLTSTDSIGIGYNALASSTSATQSIAIGSGSLSLADGGVGAIAIGWNALRSATTASGPIAIGAEALESLTSGGNGAVAIGPNAMSNVTTGGFRCTAISTGALGSLTTGTFNTAILGGTSYTTESSNITIHSNGVVGDSHTLRIGAATGTGGATELQAAYIHGIDGVNVGNVAKVVTMASDQLGTATITGGTNITITPTANTITIDADADQDIAYTSTAAATYTVLAADQFVSVDSSGGAKQVDLPDTTDTGRVIHVKDQGGNASTNNITVTTPGGTVTIDGSTTFVMNSNYQSVSVIFNGTNYEIF